MEKNREEGKEKKTKKMERMETLLSPYLYRFLPLAFEKVIKLLYLQICEVQWVWNVELGNT